MPALLALLSSLLWGTADFLGGTLTRRVRALAVYGASQVAGFALLLVAATVTGSWGTDPGYWPWAVAASVVGLLGMTAFYTALATGRMGIVSPVAALSAVVPLAVGLWRGESPASLQVLGVVLAMTGVVLASGPELSGGAAVRPMALALLTAVLFGVMFVLMAEGSAHDPVMTMTGMRITTMVIFAVILAVTRSLGGIERRDVPSLAVIGTFDAAANLTYGVATTIGLLSLTSVLGSLYPVVTAVLAAVFLHERLRPVQYAGVSVAIVGVVLISGGG
ncbi:MAG: DMT family transporter [Candidatus Nanopelagicales bacterium]